MGETRERASTCQRLNDQVATTDGWEQGRLARKVSEEGDMSPNRKNELAAVTRPLDQCPMGVVEDKTLGPE